MNSKIFFKVGWMLILSLLLYLFFVVFYLSPKINSYVSDTETKNVKEQFDKIVLTINNKSREYKNKDILIKEIDLLLTSITLAKTGYIYIFDSSGNIIINPNRELSSSNISKIALPNESNKLLLNEIKNAHENKRDFIYNWNQIYDPYNYKYEKLSWVSYNKSLDWYIVSSIYMDDFSIFVSGINSLILNISLLLFAVLMVIGIFITLKVVSPLNKMLDDVQNAKIETDDFENGVKSKDEIGFLASQFNSLLDQVENNRKNIEEQVKEKTKEIREKLYYDELTNLKNINALQESIKDEEFVSIILVDIDSFNDINELYGFSTGNLVLIETSKILKEFANRYNTNLYRIYGNQFAIVDKHIISSSKYESFIKELITLFKDKAIYIEQLDIEIFIDITSGISIAQQEPLKTAGIALKKAKKSNLRYFSYSNEFDTKEIIEKSIFWREKIKKAIDEDNVIPFYQGIFNKRKELVKYETLMRIKDESLDGKIEYIIPTEFLGVAVKTKQYLHLSTQVITKALNNLKNTDKQVSINLSFKDILDDNFIELIDRILNNTSEENKNRLVFEILESDNISDYKILEKFIQKYRKQGIKIAIDDFGTGYSNFEHILKTRPDYIKIDASLIKNINTDKNSYEIVKSIIAFSKALNIRIIAEFIHSEEVFQTALELGVDEFQGYFLAKPTPNIQ